MANKMNSKKSTKTRRRRPMSAVESRLAFTSSLVNQDKNDDSGWTQDDADEAQRPRANTSDVVTEIRLRDRKAHLDDNDTMVSEANRNLQGEGALRAAASTILLAQRWIKQSREAVEWRRRYSMPETNDSRRFAKIWMQVKASMNKPRPSTDELVARELAPMYERMIASQQVTSRTDRKEIELKRPQPKKHVSFPLTQPSNVPQNLNSDNRSTKPGQVSTMTPRRKFMPQMYQRPEHNFMLGTAWKMKGQLLETHATTGSSHRILGFAPSKS